jgi:hypothetical protein
MQRVTLKTPLDDRAYYVRKTQYFEDQGTVVPASAGLRLPRMTEKFNLPSFAKASKGF